MGHRAYSRRPDGRFRRATLENTFGLSCIFCPQCRIGNPYPAGSEPPGNCHDCGAVLRPVSECRHCGEHITLLDDRWTADDGTTACANTSAPSTVHKPAGEG
jgi:hypothetical protein